MVDVVDVADVVFRRTGQTPVTAGCAMAADVSNSQVAAPLLKTKHLEKKQQFDYPAEHSIQ